MRVERTVEAGTPLRAGDEVVVVIPPPRVVELRPERLGLAVLHDDGVIMVVDKPAGLVSHPSPGHASGTLVNALLYVGGPLSALSGEDRPGLVHRLDRDTSGVMVIARTDPAHRSLCGQFKHRETEKEYLAVVEDATVEDEGTIDAPIGRHPIDRQRFAVVPEEEGGRPAQTRWKVERRFLRGANGAGYGAGTFALLRLFPRTGRTHQIRVHLAHAGSPILCDGAYGRRTIVYAHELQGGRARRRRGERPLLDRHALHAERLRFTHPETGARVSFEAPLPADMERVLDALAEADAESRTIQR
jgi:23S rRNA pseudouridine1911/1915/1917 synthase